MTLLLILGSLGLIIFGLFYIGRGRDDNKLMTNISKHDYKVASEHVELASHKVNARILSARAQKCIKNFKSILF